MAKAVEIRGDKELQRVFRNAPRKYRLIQSRKIKRWTDKLRDFVRTDSPFDNPTPNLQRNVWSGELRKDGDSIVGSAGWGSDYGPILEFGVRPKNQGGWKIEPRKNRPGGSSTAKKDRRLRFQIGSKMFFAKSVWHPWKYGDKGSRPHWERALKRYRPDIEKDLAATMDEVFSG